LNYHKFNLKAYSFENIFVIEWLFKMSSDKIEPIYGSQVSIYTM